MTLTKQYECPKCKHAGSVVTDAVIFLMGNTPVYCPKCNTPMKIVERSMKEAVKAQDESLAREG